MKGGEKKHHMVLIFQSSELYTQIRTHNPSSLFILSLLGLGKTTPFGPGENNSNPTTNTSVLQFLELRSISPALSSSEIFSRFCQPPGCWPPSSALMFTPLSVPLLLNSPSARRISEHNSRGGTSAVPFSPFTSFVSSPRY